MIKLAIGAANEGEPSKTQYTMGSKQEAIRLVQSGKPARQVARSIINYL